MHASFADLIWAWPTPPIATLATDVGVKYVTANMWRQRDSIPPERWRDVIRAARRRRIKGVTLESLLDLYEMRWLA